MGNAEPRNYSPENVGRMIIKLDKYFYNFNDVISGEIHVFIDKVQKVAQSSILLTIELIQKEKLNYKNKIRKKVTNKIEVI